MRSVIVHLKPPGGGFQGLDSVEIGTDTSDLGAGSSTTVTLTFTPSNV
jgi:hypothetical protein